VDRCRHSYVEVYGEKEKSGTEDREEPQAVRRSDAPKGIQYRLIARLARVILPAQIATSRPATHVRCSSDCRKKERPRRSGASLEVCGTRREWARASIQKRKRELDKPKLSAPTSAFCQSNLTQRP
jgi:hypothetical protein